MTTIRIPDQLYAKVKEAVGDSDGLYLSVPDYVRKSIGEKLGLERRTNRKGGKMQGPPPGMRIKGDPAPPGTKIMSLEEAAKNSGVGGGRLIEGRKDEEDDDYD